MTFRVLLKRYGLHPTGSNGTYRRRDYLRGAAIAVLAGLGIAGVLAICLAMLRESSRFVPVLSFMLSLGILLTFGAAGTLAVCAALGLSKPPEFVDPTRRIR